MYHSKAPTAETREIFRGKVRAAERSSGENSLSTIQALDELVCFCDHWGYYEEAEWAHLRSIEAKTVALGEGHPATDRSVVQLRWLRKRMGFLEREREREREREVAAVAAVAAGRRDKLTRYDDDKDDDGDSKRILEKDGGPMGEKGHPIATTTTMTPPPPPPPPPYTEKPCVPEEEIQSENAVPIAERAPENSWWMRLRMVLLGSEKQN